MKCGSCGVFINPNGKKCPHCGKSMADSASTRPIRVVQKSVPRPTTPAHTQVAPSTAKKTVSLSGGKFKNFLICLIVIAFTFGNNKGFWKLLWNMITTNVSEETPQLQTEIQYNGIPLPPEVQAIINHQSVIEPTATPLPVKPGDVKLAAQYDEGRAAANKGNFAKALIIWKPLARSGYADAQYALGRMYARGDGIKRDFSQAKYWFELAAKQGHQDAKDKLELILKQGDAN